MPETPLLKPRELQILRLIADGMSDRDIAHRLSLKAETVRWYNKALYARLGVTSRTQAVRRAAALGLLDLPVSPPASPLRPAPPPSRLTAVARSPIRYLARGDVHIAYQTIGTGDADIIVVPGFVSHLEMSWDDPEYTAFVEQLAREARVIVFDKRGVGLSDRIQGGPTLEETVGDMRALLDAVGSTRAFIFGTSEGGAACIVFALQYPERVAGMALCNATACIARRGEEPAWARDVDAFDRDIDRVVTAWGKTSAVDPFNPSRAGDQAFRERWARIMRSAASPASIRRVLEIVRDIDVRSLVTQVTIPTLVLHRRDDRIVPSAAGRFLASRIPGARFIEFAGSDHLFFVNGEPVLRALLEFVREGGAAAAPESALAAILLVSGSGGALTREKREIVEQGRGRHLRKTLVGWTALFDSPSRAITCARRLRDLGRGRAGAIAIHVGACRTSDGVPVGIAHEVVQQLASLASPGDVVISETLRDILAGSPIALERFTPRGDDAPFGWRLAD